MSSPLGKNYDDAFYANQMHLSLASARTVIAKLQPILGDVRAVLDIGCGVGGWLKAVGEVYPRAELFGVDHPDIPSGKLQINDAQFFGCNLTDEIDLNRRFDLVVSLEVAEHIDAAYTDIFIDSLTRHSDCVLFSAAAPHQGGTGHVNEQWPSYWVHRFARREFKCFDIVRPLIWDDDGVASWYKQNAMLFARDSASVNIHGCEDWAGRAIIHPGMWMRKTEPLRQRVSRVVSGQKPNHNWRDT